LIHYKAAEYHIVLTSQIATVYTLVYSAIHTSCVLQSANDDVYVKAHFLALERSSPFLCLSLYCLSIESYIMYFKRFHVFC